MKSIASAAIIIGFVAAQAAATSQKLRGRNLEGECEGVGNGVWVPTPGCKGAVFCFQDGPFFLYPCSDDKRYDEAFGGCRPAAVVTCSRQPWASIYTIVSDAVSDALDNVDQTATNIRRCDTYEEKLAFKECKRDNCEKDADDVDKCKADCRTKHCGWE